MMPWEGAMLANERNQRHHKCLRTQSAPASLVAETLLAEAFEVCRAVAACRRSPPFTTSSMRKMSVANPSGVNTIAGRVQCCSNLGAIQAEIQVRMAFAVVGNDEEWHQTTTTADPKDPFADASAASVDAT
mmetsp:Transcript_17884/g.37985  ORF Transcript_17884/g.37985 Transcript_17884/m.37985 type:complete len:131 (-) Transcript_17884:256-648(-)